MKTTLFNLHEIKIKEGSVLIEFYAGDIFDIYSDILLLSAYKGKFFPKSGTTWGCLFARTGITIEGFTSKEIQRISKNILSFNINENKHFAQLVAIELSDFNRPGSFTSATLMNRYRELVDFLETHPSEEVESISLPLLGTGNQGLSLEDSVTELLKTFNQLKKTTLKIIRVFAKDFESVGVLNKKINELLNRTEVVHTTLLNAAMNEAKEILKREISMLCFETITDLISLADSNHASLNTFGIKGRIFAERLCDKLIVMYGITQEEPSTLHSKITGLTPMLLNDRPYVLSHLRLLQTYGNQAAHGVGTELNHQDAASIIISMIRLVDFYEYKLLSSMDQN
jgi:hypothetical protein